MMNQRILILVEHHPEEDQEGESGPAKTLENFWPLIQNVTHD